MKNIIFIAPPAAGKGTQSEWLKDKFNYEHISTGDLLRQAIAEGSELGKQVEDVIAGGNLVSDDIMIALLKDTLTKLPTDKPFILDGFPRTIKQAEALNELLNEINVTDLVAIYLNIDEEEAMRRALGRVSCPNCKKGYNIYYEAMKPKVEDICDECGSKLDRRSDDNEESFKHRFETYIENSTPVINFYQEKNLLKEVKVDRESIEIFEDIVKLLSEE
ncbi:MAG: nucleoside monophosphate kinase [Bacilli bacterium]|nr:nucleoside monophosphate kinase [Bacilli bacterium]